MMWRPSGAVRWGALTAGSMGMLGIAGIGLLVGLNPASALPQAVPRVQVSAPEEAEAFGLIERCARASHAMSYSGTQFVTIFGQPQTVSVIADVEHKAGEGTMLSIHATAAADQRKVWEQDADEDTWTPSLSSALTPYAVASPALALLKQHFSARVTGASKVAGRDTQIVELTRASGSVASRMWLDSQTALPLRREIYDDRGRLARLTGYLDFSVLPVPSQGQRLAASTSSSTEEAVAEGEIATMRGKGWSIPQRLGALDLVEVRRSPDAVLHAVYSDGLSTVSVFQQSGRFKPTDRWTKQTVAKHAVWVMGGIPGAISWSAKGKVYTVVADAGAPELDSMIKVLPLHERRSGILHRLHHGADRVMSWFNPFG